MKGMTMLEKLKKFTKDHSFEIGMTAFTILGSAAVLAVYAYSAKQETELYEATKTWSQKMNAALADGTMFAYVDSIGRTHIIPTPSNLIS